MLTATPAQVEFDRLKKTHNLRAKDVSEMMQGMATKYAVRSWFKSRKSRKARNISQAALFVLKSKLEAGE